MTHSLLKRSAAEAFGTFWLVLGGCGTAVLALAFPYNGYTHTGVFIGVALAFGLTLLTMCYAIGPVSGCHINPAVTVGMFVSGRFSGRDVIPYIVAQVIGALVASLTLYAIASGQVNFNVHAGFASNGYGVHSPGNYSMLACAICEIVLTCFFIFIIALSTDKLAPSGFAGIAIGLTLTLIHLISIPVTNTSVNPARSTGPAIFAGGIALSQLWFFWVMPIIGAIIGGGLYRYFGSEAAPAAQAAAPAPAAVS